MKFLKIVEFVKNELINLKKEKVVDDFSSTFYQLV